LLKVPNLAIHFTRESNNLKINLEDNLIPIMSHNIYEQLSNITYEDYKGPIA